MKIFAGKKREHATVSERREIYAPHGACMIFHRNYFQRGGSLGHVAFLFGEEIFIAETTARLGLSVVYAPELRVLDYEHASTGWLVSTTMNRYHREAITGLIREFYK